MPEVLRIVLGVVGGFAIIALGIVLVVRERRQLLAVEAAWRGFVQSRGFEFSPHRGAFCFRPELGSPPRVWGSVGGVSFVVELAGWKSIRNTQVVVASLARPSTNRSVSEISPDQLDEGAAHALAALRQLRPDARIAGWGISGQPTLAVGWKGLERDAMVLDRAIALTVALGHRPPTQI